MPELTESVGMIKPTTLELLWILRRRKGWTRAVLAQKIGVSERTVRSWEEYTRNPKSHRTPRPLILKAVRDFIEEHSN